MDFTTPLFSLTPNESALLWTNQPTNKPTNQFLPMRWDFFPASHVSFCDIDGRPLWLDSWIFGYFPGVVHSYVNVNLFEDKTSIWGAPQALSPMFWSTFVMAINQWMKALCSRAAHPCRGTPKSCSVWLAPLKVAYLALICWSLAQQVRRTPPVDTSVSDDHFVSAKPNGSLRFIDPVNSSIEHATDISYSSR